MPRALSSALVLTLLPVLAAAGDGPPAWPGDDDHQMEVWTSRRPTDLSYDDDPVVEPARHSPDILRLPSPTPAEEPEFDEHDYAPKIAPGYEYLLPPVPDEQPPLVRPLVSPSPNVDWKSARLAGTWLPGSGNHLGLLTFDMRTTFAVGTSGVTLSPGTGIHFVSGPRRTDLPSRLYDFYAELAWTRQLAKRFGVELAVIPGYFSDFRGRNSDAVRVLGRGIGYFGLTPTTQLVFGVAWFDRDDVPALPVMGAIYVPDRDLRLELVFPRPRIATRIDWSERRERWVYLLGEFGGGSWAVERAWGADDVANYRDWRLIGGLETRQSGGVDWLFEVGYVFSRRLEYKSGIGSFGPDPTAMARMGMIF